MRNTEINSPAPMNKKKSQAKGHPQRQNHEAPVTIPAQYLRQAVGSPIGQQSNGLIRFYLPCKIAYVITELAHFSPSESCLQYFLGKFSEDRLMYATYKTKSHPQVPADPAQESWGFKQHKSIISVYMHDIVI